MFGSVVMLSGKECGIVFWVYEKMMSCLPCVISFIQVSMCNVEIFDGAVGEEVVKNL